MNNQRNIALHSAQLPKHVRDSILEDTGAKFGVKLSLDPIYIIGRGSFGIVVRATSTDPSQKDSRHPLLPKEYAIKIVSAKSTNPNFLKNWETEVCNEVKLICKLNHPNIIKVIRALGSGNHLTVPAKCYMLMQTEMYQQDLHRCSQEVCTI